MSSLFFEKAIWGFFALVASLIAVIYKLFNGSLSKDLTIKKNEIKEELKECFEKDFLKKVDDLEGTVKDLKKELESFKRHEDANSKIQQELTKKLLLKLNKLDKIDPDFLVRILNEK